MGKAPFLSMFSATDVANFIACQHISTLEHAESRQEITKPFFNDPVIELLQKLGLEHEQRYLCQLLENDLTIVQIDTPQVLGKKQLATRLQQFATAQMLSTRPLFLTVRGVADQISWFASKVVVDSVRGPMK
jgi:hypothetical protein